MVKERDKNLFYVALCVVTSFNQWYFKDPWLAISLAESGCGDLNDWPTGLRFRKTLPPIGQQRGRLNRDPQLPVPVANWEDQPLSTLVAFPRTRFSLELPADRSWPLKQRCGTTAFR